MNLLISKMLSHADPSQVEGLSRFFKTGPGQYGEGDKFLGIKVPVTRQVVKECWKELVFPELEECLASEYHELRLAALLVLVEQFSHARKDPARQKACVDFYLAHTDCINNWDLVDLSCYPLLGVWLLDKDRTLLYDLARNGRTFWEQRIGMVSTMTFIRHGELEDTFAIADILLHHPHDLIHKAVGWLLREAGKRDKEALVTFLATRHRTMPRTMLRYALEKFPEPERKAYLKSDSGFVNHAQNKGDKVNDEAVEDRDEAHFDASGNDVRSHIVMPGQEIHDLKEAQECLDPCT